MRMTLFRPLCSTLGLFVLGMAAACGEPAEPLDDPALAAAIEADLERFDSNPQAFLNTLPTKTLVSPVSLFDPTNVAAKSYVDAKNSVIRQDPTADAPGANDQARNLVDALVLTNLADMHSLRTATLPESPWSDDYWGLYAGSTAKRYADPIFVRTFPEFPTYAHWADETATLEEQISLIEERTGHSGY